MGIPDSGLRVESKTVSSNGPENAVPTVVDCGATPTTREAGTPAANAPALRSDSPKSHFGRDMVLDIIPQGPIEIMRLWLLETPLTMNSMVWSPGRTCGITTLSW